MKPVPRSWNTNMTCLTQDSTDATQLAAVRARACRVWRTHGADFVGYLCGEELRAEEMPANRRAHRQLAPPGATPGLNIEEVIIRAPMVSGIAFGALRTHRNEPQRRQRALHGRVARQNPRVTAIGWHASATPGAAIPQRASSKCRSIRRCLVSNQVISGIGFTSE